MTKLVIAGLGPGDPAYVPGPVLAALGRASTVLLRTARHPAVRALEEHGIVYESFDHVYARESSFDRVYAQIAQNVVAAATGKEGVVAYATPGHPLVAETPTRLILEGARKQGISVLVLAAPSGLEAMYAALGVDPGDGLEIINAYDIEDRPPSGRNPVIVLQVHDRLIASAVKLALMERHPPETRVYIVRAAGVPGEEQVTELPLYELDRTGDVDHLTSVFVPAGALEEPQGRASLSAMDELAATVAALRGPSGCPWDRQQDHRSLRPYLLEEAYEVLDAIDQQDMHKLREELGDLLLQVVLHGQIAQEKDEFDLDDVARSINSKLIRRHPHVFGDGQARTPGEVVMRWEEIKAAERAQEHRSALDGVAPGPAMVRAVKVQERAARVGFDWPCAEEVLEKLVEEVRELRAAHAQGDPARVEDEVGDVLFSVLNYARHTGVDAEVALHGTVRKFCERFRMVESGAERAGKRLESMTLEEMDALWEQAKRSK